MTALKKSPDLIALDIAASPPSAEGAESGEAPLPPPEEPSEPAEQLLAGIESRLAQLKKLLPAAPQTPPR